MDTQLPPILESKLGDFRRRVWTVKLAEAVFAAIVGIAISWLLVFLLDRVCDTPGWLRLVILISGAATLCIGAPLKWHRWVWSQRRLEDAARLLRRTFPALGDQLLGIVELARMDHAAAGRSERLVQAAMQQAADAIKNRDFTHAVPEPRHRQWGWAAAGAAALVLAGFLFVNDAARNAFVRWIAPLGNTERFTFARIGQLPSRIVVPYAEPFQLQVRLAGATRWAPGQASARLGSEDRIVAGLGKAGYVLNFPPQKEDGTLSLSVGDVRKKIEIEPRNRPDLADLVVHERLPDYLHYDREQRIDVRGGAVSILKGAEAAFEAHASRDIVEARMDSKPQKVSGADILTGYQTVTGDEQRKFTWRDRDGLTPREPLTLDVRAVADEPPSIMASRDSPEEVVLDSEVITFSGEATDDFGVKEMGIEWVGSQTGEDGSAPIHGERICAAGGPETKDLKAQATFCATRDGIEPQTVEVRLWTIDYLPGRPHSHSASFTLQVLNKTDHAIWLTQQFGKWLEAAKESYEREQQLHETNKELRAMNPQELDRPENRQKVAQQAAAENAQAARLAGLTQSGRNLVEQATKNDEFDAKRLETWATMLKTLQDIAANRMPSVADLLKQSANAPSGETAGTQRQTGRQTAPASSPAALAGNTQKSAGGLSQGPMNASPQGAPPKIDPNATPKYQPGPGLSMREAGNFKAGGQASPTPGNSGPKPPGNSKLRLPTVNLASAPSKTPRNNDNPPPQSPAQQTMDTAVKQQKDLLAQFAKVSDQLSEILGSLEASTFVKRLKAASHQQMGLADSISQKTLDSFGVKNGGVTAAQPIEEKEKDQSEVVRVIQSDLDAYYQRKQDSRFKVILDDMQKTEIVRALAGDGDKLAENLSGQSMIGSEYWADTLDRWAEELVAASNSNGSSTCGGDSLPPEIVLKVMQVLRDEMKLRDETREAENSKPALDAGQYHNRANLLGETQAELDNRTNGAEADIVALPNGGQTFGKEIHLMQEVSGVMRDAKGILYTPDTGPQAIAAETEAIELLLQAKRSGKKPGGGGGSNPGGGTGPDSASEAALAELGPDGEAASVIASRTVGQDTGRAGRQFPEEYKTGLDQYFSLLEGQGGVK
ncbi:MAG TPA: hypothetical protein VHY22_01555 [Chthoniobacteraceae bacterium]|jgi:hypothetical protein|nr:hypothetical protein [Chthoniobacteraceae bacterium]